MHRLKGEFIDDNLNSMDWWREKHRGYAKREAADAIAGEKFKTSKSIYYRFPPYLRAFIFFPYAIFSSWASLTAMLAGCGTSGKGFGIVGWWIRKSQK